LERAIKLKTLESIVQTQNSFYSCCYDLKTKEFVFKRIGSENKPVWARYEPLYIGNKLSIENSCLVLKDGKRVVLRTSPMVNVFEKSTALLA